MKEYNVNYKELRKAIVKSCSIDKEVSDIDFSVNYEKLTELTDSIGVIPIALTEDDGISHAITTSDIPAVSEYFKGEKLEWMDSNKTVTNIVFVEKDVAEEVAAYIEENENPVNILAHIISTYPCYYAMVVGYLSTDPVRLNKLNYFIECRANAVALKKQ